MFFANFSKEYAQFFCILKVAFLPREKHGKNKGAITMEKIKLGIIGVGNMGTCHIETTAPRSCRPNFTLCLHVLSSHN